MLLHALKCNKKQADPVLLNLATKLNTEPCDDLRYSCIEFKPSKLGHHSESGPFAGVEREKKPSAHSFVGVQSLI